MDDKRNMNKNKPEKEHQGIGYEKPDTSTEKRSPGQGNQENEGEGNKSADRQYREHVREFEEQHDVESLGRSARQDIERDPEGYRAAEEEGKSRMAEEDPEVTKKE
jgi:hypothetical protein